MSLPSFTILFVDDSSEDRSIFQRYLRRDTLRTYICLEAATGREALQICAATPKLDCVVLDHSLSDMDGVELLKQLIRSCHPNAMAFVMVTGSGNEQVAVSALKQGAHDYLVKAAATPSDLQRAVANAIEKVQLHRVLEEQRRQLREQHELVDRILETTTEGIMLIKPDRTVAQMNRRAEMILGLDRAQVIGQPFQLGEWVVEVPDGSAWQTGAMPIEQVLDTGQPVDHAILSLRRGPSERVLLSVNAVPLRSLSGELEGVIASFRDVTEQWQVEDAKRSQARDFQTTLNNMPAIVAHFDRQLRHLYVNIEVERAFGIAPDQFLGKTNRELGMPAELCDYWDAMLLRVFESGEPTTFQFVTPFVDRPHHFQSRVVPEFDPGGQVVSVLCVTLDQTEQREAEAALQTIADASAGLSLS
ncbi:MAG TPA: PAS domain-containing protein, partial [Roseiflexaceae bacterium]|nr:PAS domain-containing protein [Roseiflexaceae bacterium]